MPGVIRWSNCALENKQTWSGPTYTKYVYQLHRLRASDAALAGLGKEFVASLFRKSKRKRPSAAAREGLRAGWLDCARESAQDSTDASNLCVSAAGNAAFCE